MSILIMGLVFSTVLVAYTHSSKRAEWSGMSLAAQAMCLRQMEQFFAAKWDTQANPPVDQTTNVPLAVISVLDLPVSGTNVVWATNTATVSTLQISANPLVCVKMITVNTVWAFQGTVFTNTVVDYRSPDQ
jgi:hypothetical protein